MRNAPLTQPKAGDWVAFNETPNWGHSSSHGKEAIHVFRVGSVEIKPTGDVKYVGSVETKPKGMFIKFQPTKLAQSCMTVETDDYNRPSIILKRNNPMTNWIDDGLNFSLPVKRTKTGLAIDYRAFDGLYGQDPWVVPGRLIKIPEGYARFFDRLVKTQEAK